MSVATAHVRLAQPTAPGEGPLRVSSTLELIGNTPVVEIRRVRDGVAPGVRVLAKLEGFNPGGSVKDRPALKMIEDGLARGRLTPGKTILDSTSGNTGIALAMIGAALGYPVKLVMPGNVSVERKNVVAAFGAEAVFSDPLEGSDGAIRLCRKILADDPDRYFKPDQYNNPANALAHYASTGPEIWRQTDGAVTHFVASIGTSGTIMGTGRYLKEQNPDVQVVAAEPEDAFHGIEGLKHMASSIVPGIYDEAALDQKIGVDTEDAYNMVYRLGREEGLIVGQSCGAAHVVALGIARTLVEGTVVVLFPDFGDRYLSTNLWLGWKRPEEVSP
jgi:cysteine synthase B